MKKHLLKLFLGSAAVMVLAACGDGGDGGNVITPPPGGGGDPVAFEENFGAGFAAAFQADANDDPIDPMRDDLIGVQPALDPLEPPM